MAAGDLTDLTQPDPNIAEAHELHRALGPVHLTMIGIGCIIGAGIFVITGTAAAQHAGPAVLISFVIAALGCLFAGLCYAEFASMIPESGSAYTYAYATMGRFMAWFIGWNWCSNIWCRLPPWRWGGRDISRASLATSASPCRRNS